jgi:PAS domain S-box-containing protein
VNGLSAALLTESTEVRELKEEIELLRRQLDEANGIIGAIRNGEVDALLLGGEKGERAYVLDGADRVYRAIVEQMEEGCATLDADGTILFCNGNFATLLELPLERLMGVRLFVLLAKAADREVLGGFLAAGEGCLRCELCLRGRDDKRVPVLIAANHIKVGDERFVCAVFTDLSERKRFEAELLQLDRLNLIGEMAAGIGHEIRNPLTTVRGYLQMFRRKDKYAEHGEQFATMIEELDRANAIISEYLSLAKNKKVELKPGNLNRVVDVLFPLLQADAFRLGHTVDLATGDIPEVRFDEREIRQLLLNLVRNGLEAMSPGGKLTIRTCRCGEETVLAVQDTGTGMPAEILDRLGTPFLTTKEKGTGLGLAVCCRIAERHGAKIRVKTSPHGTTFSVKFRT